MSRAAAWLAAGLLLAGCKQQAAAPKPAETVAERGLRSVEQDLWSAAKHPEQTRFRGVSAWPQARVEARPLEVAVCGQYNALGEAPDVFVPFVSVVTLGGAPGGPVSDRFDHIVGTTATEAGRVYAAMVLRCYEGGGETIPPASASAVSTLATMTEAAQPATAPRPANGDVVVKQSATIHADPHGTSVRTAPRGAVLHVFSQAPGGWYQVGDTVPWGWIHESMLERH